MLVCHPFSAGTLFIISYSKDLRRTTARMHGFGKHFFHGSRVAQAALLLEAIVSGAVTSRLERACRWLLYCTPIPPRLLTFVNYETCTFVNYETCTPTSPYPPNQ